MLIGSPEWFYEKAQSKEKIEYWHRMEMLRAKFLDRFSPTHLKKMSGRELLIEVFENNSKSMMSLLMNDSQYRFFGASSEYAYMSIIYKGSDGIWTLFEKNKHIKLTQYDAETKAEYIRDKIVECTDLINKSELKTISDYTELENKLSSITNFYNYVTVLKYFQMLYPYYFVGMYADHTLERCISILGLKHMGKSSNKRIQNMGVISLFIRHCDVNNVVFGSIYGDEWGWDSVCGACSAAETNNTLLFQIHNNLNLSLYNIGDLNKEETLIQESKRLEEDIEKTGVVGKEKEAIIKIRINQSEFRNRLLLKHDTCCICGVSNKELLIASHIKPWSIAEANEKIDVNNGFLLCPNHDKLFDRGFISFDDAGHILISNKLSSVDRIFTNVNENMSITLDDKNRDYLSYHRDYVFQD